MCFGDAGAAQCGSPPIGRHAKVVVTGAAFDASDANQLHDAATVATYVCDPGYDLIGSVFNHKVSFDVSCRRRAARCGEWGVSLEAETPRNSGKIAGPLIYSKTDPNSFAPKFRLRLTWTGTLWSFFREFYQRNLPSRRFSFQRDLNYLSNDFISLLADDYEWKRVLELVIFIVRGHWDKHNRVFSFLNFLFN